MTNNPKVPKEENEINPDEIFRQLDERQARQTEAERSARPAQADKAVRKVEKKTRRSKLDEVDEFYVDPKEIPDGFSVEWKRGHIYGKEDTPHLNDLSRDGWEPAQPKDFPSLVGKYHKGQFITGGRQQDLILMIRPTELTEEARAEDKINANKQVRTKFEEIGIAKPGEAPRVDSKGRSLVKINTSYSAIPVE